MKKRRFNKFLRIISIAMIFFLLVAALLYTDRNLRILILETAKSRVGLIMSDCANNAVNQAISNNDIQYDDIIRVTRDADGSITSLQTDIIKLNLVRTDIDHCFSQEMDKNSVVKLQIPFGSVIGNEYTIGRGPCLNYNINVSVNTSTDYKSQFYSAGINQTLHQIVVAVSGEAYIMSPWYKGTVDFYTEYIVAETVITGIVPETLADFDVKK